MTEGYLETNGVRLWYDVTGPARRAPVILVMGVGASAVWWPRDFVAGLVAAGYRVVRFDNRDIGLSSHIDFARAPYTVEDMTTDTTDLLGALDIDSAHFIGMSLGGIIAQLAAIREPSHVRSLLLISTTPGSDKRLSSPTKAFRAFVSRAPNPEQSALEHQVDFCRVLAGSRFPFDEHYYRELVSADLARGTNLHSSQGRLPASASRIEALARVHVPTLIIHGDEDPIFPIDHAEALGQAMPASSLVKWQGVGHEVPPPLFPELARLALEHLADVV